MTHAIPNDALDDRHAFVGMTGSGKTFSAGTAVERILDRKGRVIIPDPLGVWYGLRLMADGVTPSPYNVVIFGGPHADLPISEHAGALIGETVAGIAESCILDLSEFPSAASERRFMFAFLTALYRHANNEPVHLVFDEADMWAPERIMDKEGDAMKLHGQMQTIVRRGRIKGLISWMITQRPAALSKNCLSQVDGLIAFKLTATHDRKALGAWIEGQADRERGKEIMGSLAELQKGQAVVWIPGRGVLATQQFPLKTTFDSSKAPKRGEKRRVTKLKTLDIPALRDRLSTVEAEVAANDPAKLKGQIKQLNLELTKVRSVNIQTITPNPKALEEAETIGFAKGYVEGCKVSNTDLALLEPALEALIPGMRMLQERFEQALRNSGSRMNSSIPHMHKERIPQKTFKSTILPKVPSHVTPIPKSNGSRSADVKLPPGELAILVAAAQFGSVEREQLTVLTGYKRSTRNEYVKRLQGKGLIEVNGSTIKLTDAGNDALPPFYQPLPTGVDLQEYWLNRLPEGEKKILTVLIEAYPNEMQRADLDDATGYKSSSRNEYIKRMKAKRLVSISGSSISASEDLF